MQTIDAVRVGDHTSREPTQLFATAALFATTGFVWFAYWLESTWCCARTPPRVDWGAVVGFSAALLLLGITIVVFGRGFADVVVTRWSIVAGAGASLSSLANIVEDGLRVEPAFYVFIIGTLILNVGLLVAAIGIVVRAHGREKLLALIPAGTLAGVLFFVTAGGFTMLITWLLAAGLIARYRRRYLLLPVAVFGLAMFSVVFAPVSMAGISYWWDVVPWLVRGVIRDAWSSLTGQPLTRDLFPF